MASFGYLQITRECNQHCRFCSSPANENVISYKEGKIYIDHFIEKKFFGVILTGGEPTLCPDLPRFLRYLRGKDIEYVVITNGQKLADYDYLKSLKEAGLYKVNISMYSYKPKVQAFLTEKKDSRQKIAQALKNLGKIGGIVTNINTVLNHYNADHLSETVKWVVKNFPFVHHFVWNNLDPWRNRAEYENPDTIARLNELELELHKAMQFLKSSGRTFRVEKMPLCYMKDFEEYSADTRRIIKSERRWTLFLDPQGLVRTGAEHYDYGQACKSCYLRNICVGLYKMGKFYDEKELHPVFANKEEIIKKVLSSGSKPEKIDQSI